MPRRRPRPLANGSCLTTLAVGPITAGQAFAPRLFLLVLVILPAAAFVSLYRTLLVPGAVVLATAGLRLGTPTAGRSVGGAMGGIGVIALAGVVVNSAIVLIGARNNDPRGRGLEPPQAVLRAGARRPRPVPPTAVTAVLGLMPMVPAMNVDLLGRDVAFRAPSTQGWAQLSGTIAGDMAFATPLLMLAAHAPHAGAPGEGISARLTAHRRRGWRPPTDRGQRRPRRGPPSGRARTVSRSEPLSRKQEW